MSFVEEILMSFRRAMFVEWGRDAVGRVTRR